MKLENGKGVDLDRREPEAEYRVLREQWDQRLNCQGAEGVSDLGTNCTAIDAAMQKLLEGSGLPVRDPAKKPADVTPPTAWSSGRASGKGNE